MGAVGLRRSVSAQPRWRPLAAWVLLPVALWGQGQLRVEIQEGAGAVVPGGALSSRRFTVVVKDEMGQPVPGATVHFRLPAEGPTGTFSSGLRSESTLTDSRGMATVYGIQWGSQPGKLEISVLASNGDRKGTAAIPVEVSRHAVVTREDRSNPGFKAPSSGRKWLLLALVGAGAAAGVGMAGKGGGKATVYQPPAVVVVPPSIGTPTITVGKP